MLFEKWFEKANRTVRSAIKNLRLGGINVLIIESARFLLTTTVECPFDALFNVSQSRDTFDDHEIPMSITRVGTLRVDLG